MSDLIERLREFNEMSNTMRLAADEIERLRAAVREANRACALAHEGERIYRNEMIRLTLEPK